MRISDWSSDVCSSDLRPANSVRRTTSIDVSWPDGIGGQRLFIGGARDVITPADGGTPRIVAQGSYRARLTEDKTITEISPDPSPQGLQRVIGAKAAGHFRQLLREVLPGLIAQPHPLSRVLGAFSAQALG